MVLNYDIEVNKHESKLQTMRNKGKVSVTLILHVTFKDSHNAVGKVMMLHALNFSVLLLAIKSCLKI
jgi:hypothetical protein